MNKQNERILGIDPGTIVTGYGLIAPEGNRWKAVDYGCIKPPSSLKLTDRYLIIYEGVEALIDKYEPSIVVIESQYIGKNPQSAIKLGMARGVAILAAKKKGLKVIEYMPTQAKLAVTGTGAASKYQVQGMIKNLLHLSELPTPEDAADALAIAVCHGHCLQTARRLGEEI